jgi:Zn-dependent peptidase ImmA (M78 family)
VRYNRGDYRHKWRIERFATAIRSDLGLDQLTPLSPWRLADAIPAHVFYPEDFDDDGLAERVRTVNWDGFAFSSAGDNTLIVVLNQTRPPTRQTATLMEEFSHHLLRHVPSAIALNPKTGFLERSYDRSQEEEAYDLGAALLLPKERIQHEVAARRNAEQIAADHGCSDDIVLYRIKRMRLWQRYVGYAA